ncbi:MAG: molybdate-binding protein, partial [Candidatus Eremiobacteraeota bacterium]|nr:molybdate-binding protein [Candidatus Eremiobacteraeota bacterium]
PVAWEPYDLALPAASLGEPRIARVIAVLRETAFRVEVEALGGYDCGRAGEVRIVAPDGVRP